MGYLMAFVAIHWLVLAHRLLSGVRAIRPLPSRDPANLTAEPPRVSVVVAARNERARIEQTVRGLLEQEGVDLELIIVDDRSDDGTRDILRRLAAEEPRLQLVTVDRLPAGWLGKCHACSRGAAMVSGEWILFTDADVHMWPDLVVRAVATARQQRADHLTLLPSVVCTGVLAQGALLAHALGLVLYVSPERINADRGKRALGVGAFNLVRAESYRAIGGHEPLRMEVIDDVKLGLLLRRAGFRQRVYSGLDEIEADWAQNVGQIIKASEKNWFAGMNYSLAKSAALLVYVPCLWLAAVLGPVLYPPLGWAALVGLLSLIVPAWALARQFRWPWYAAALAPLGLLVFVASGVHSVTKTLLQGGIRWRDTFYPLSQLRAGLVR